MGGFYCMRGWPCCKVHISRDTSCDVKVKIHVIGIIIRDVSFLDSLCLIFIGSRLLSLALLYYFPLLQFERLYLGFRDFHQIWQRTWLCNRKGDHDQYSHTFCIWYHKLVAGRMRIFHVTIHWNNMIFRSWMVDFIAGRASSYSLIGNGGVSGKHW